MSVKEITLLSIYAMAKADGKIGGGANKILDILNIYEKEANEKIQNELLREFSKLSKETKEAIIATIDFIMKADGIEDTKEKELFNKFLNNL